MKIRSVTIQNFRGYKRATKIELNDLTLIVGKNDVGKSTVLEALDIFFGNKKPDKNDLHISCDVSKDKISIAVEFADLPSSIDIDEGAKTSLQDEYLLNKGGLLEVKKIFKPASTTQPKIVLIANYPKGEENLLVLKNTDLKKVALDLDIDKSSYHASINNSIRKAIWKSKQIALDERDLEIDKEDGKQIYSKLEQEMPVYSLFSADRKNTDQDSEVQEPIKSSVKQIVRELDSELEPIKNQVLKKLDEIAKGTINKLKEMNPEVASSLKPVTEIPAWEKAFSVTIESDGIPLNKRGSGVKRLVLINFFRNEAERAKNDKQKTSIVYAIEEPETSQHPDWQQKLFEALKELTETGNIQVILTSHHPELTGLVSLENIRFIKKKDNQEIVVIPQPDYGEVAKTLGVLPRIDGVKVAVCVEGPHDVRFYKAISSVFVQEFDSNDERILWIPTGGQTLSDFINEKYLDVLKIPQVHYYDKNGVASTNGNLDCIRTNGNWGECTTFQELENYMHPSLYKIIWPDLKEDFVDLSSRDWLTNWGERDIPKELSEFISVEFKDGNKNLRNYSSGNIKKSFAQNAHLMTKQLFEELGAFDELQKFFNAINSKLSS